MTKGTSSDPLVGTLIGDRYILERQLGRGSHGFVYRATHNEIPRAYAIKFLRPSFGGHLAPAKLERFRREAFSLASLRHPAVVQVTDYGVHSELGPYLVMDLLQGHGLDKYLKMHAPLRPLDLFELVSQLASALAAAHEQGIVHRDLKSENVMILSSTYTTKVLRVCILDFGVVKLLESDGEEHIPAARATVIGTPYTMAPEQITGQAIDCRADIYALGVLLYEAVTRELPFVGQEAWEQIESHLHDFPDPPSKRSKVGGWVPPSLDRFLLSMLAKDPAHRPASMAEVQEI
ncbi:MAG: serine/threonine-protein kinase, partial [Nannocystaceae bacterium]